MKKLLFGLVFIISVGQVLASTAVVELPKVRKFAADNTGALPKNLVIEDYQMFDTSAAPVVATSRGAFDVVPKDVLLYFFGWIEKQRPFRYTCKRMLALPDTCKLSVTLPAKFTRSDQWRAILQGKKPFPWAERVTKLNLFQLDEYATAIDADGLIQPREGYGQFFLMKLKETFPNVEEITLRYATGHIADYPAEQLRGAFGPKSVLRGFAFGCSLDAYFRTTYLNERRARLLGELYVMNGLSERYWRDPTKGHWHPPENGLLYIPWDETRLHNLLDLYERFKSRPNFIFTHRLGLPWGLKKTDELRMFICALAEFPDLWEVVLFIHMNICPIDKLVTEFAVARDPEKKKSVTMTYVATDAADFAHANIKKLIVRLKKLKGPDTMEILELMRGQMQGLAALGLDYDYKREKITRPMLLVLGKVLKRGDFKAQAVRLFTRLFALYRPVVWSIEEIRVKKIYVDEQKFRETSSEELWAMIENINNDLYMLSDDEFAKFAAFAKDTLRLRRYHLIQSTWFPQFLCRYESEFKGKE